MKSNRVHLVLASLAMVTAALLGKLLVPHALMARHFAPHELEDMIPTDFGDWRLVPGIQLVTPTVAEQTDPAEANPGGPAAWRPEPIYSQEVARGYANSQGDIVMLLVAYGPVQDYRLKAHRPEFCYVASGFRIIDKSSTSLPYRDGGRPLRVTRLTAVRESRVEPVSYWMRIGDDVSTGALDRQLLRLRYGLQGIIPDGELIRVSSIGLVPAAAFQLQDQFIHDWLAALRPADLPFFIGTR